MYFTKAQLFADVEACPQRADEFSLLSGQVLFLDNIVHFYGSISHALAHEEILIFMF